MDRIFEEASLMDFLDEEVVDEEGIPVGTLGCYWEFAPGVAAFYGVNLKSHPVLRVVPAMFSFKDERHSCIRLRFSAHAVETAPEWDCSMELDGFLQEKVYAHFGLVGKSLHPRLKDFAHPLRATG